MKRTLPLVSPPNETLGRSTIMDRGLAARHGILYVHVAVFAIDVDRIREASEALDDPRPFAWEVFLTEQYLERTLDPTHENTRSLLEDIVSGVLEAEPSEDGLLGSQFPFAVWHLVDRGVWPKELNTWFRSWGKPPRDLGRSLDELQKDAQRHTRELATFCLEYPMSPGAAPPTNEALKQLISPLEPMP